MYFLKPLKGIAGKKRENSSLVSSVKASGQKNSLAKHPDLRIKSQLPKLSTMMLRTKGLKSSPDFWYVSKDLRTLWELDLPLRQSIEFRLKYWMLSLTRFWVICLMKLFSASHIPSIMRSGSKSRITGKEVKNEVTQIGLEITSSPSKNFFRSTRNVCEPCSQFSPVDSKFQRVSYALDNRRWIWTFHGPSRKKSSCFFKGWKSRIKNIAEFLKRNWIIPTKKRRISPTNFCKVMVETGEDLNLTRTLSAELNPFNPS